MTSTYDSERWKQARRAALARDRVCQDCGASDSLHVHHIRPVRDHENPDDAHFLENLVVLCESCHPKWEGRDSAPELLDRGTGLSLSRLVHDLSKDTLSAHNEPPGPWLLYEYFVEYIAKDRYTCDFCFQPLEQTRGATDHCPSCGRSGKLWVAYEETPSLDEIHDRVSRLAKRLENTVAPVDRDVMHDIAAHLWTDSDYHGRIEDITRVVARKGLEHGYEAGSVQKEYSVVCPLPRPTPT